MRVLRSNHITNLLAVVDSFLPRATAGSRELKKLVERANDAPEFPNSVFGSHNPIVSRFGVALFNLSRQFQSATEMVDLENSIMADFED